MMKLRRNTYKFEHPKQNFPMIIKAYSEKRAWEKLRRKVARIIAGDWAIFYNPAAVNRIMKEVKLTK